MALRRIAIALSTMMTISLTASVALSATANCGALSSKKCHSEFNANDSSNHTDQYMDPKDVQQCILRGYDAPISCRNNEGKSAGVRVEGSSGFTYGTVQSPENSPGKTGAGPTLGLANMRLNLGFDWGGGCKIFGINICADGKQPPGPLPVKIDLDHKGPSSESDRCPEKSDPWARLGGKVGLSTAGLSLGCGGTVPLSNYETTLNARPDHLVVTEYSDYQMRVYQKASNGKYMLNPYYYAEYSLPNHLFYRAFGMLSLTTCTLCMGGSFDLPPLQIFTKRVLMKSLTGAIPLPGHLCNAGLLHNPGGMPLPQYMKSVELTPPIAQMITYNNRDTINLRLMSRNTIKRGFPMTLFGLPEIIMYFYPEPPEDEKEEDEKFLILPVFNGLPVVPVGRAPTIEEMIRPSQIIVPSPPGVIPTMPFSPLFVPEITFDSMPIPSEACGAEPVFFKKTAHISGDILIEQPTTLCEGSEEECKAMKNKCEAAGGEDCDTISPVPINDLSCETTKIPLKQPEAPAACEGMMQWVVLDRHNLVYPPGTNVTPIEVDGRTNLMMPTNEKSRIFTQKDTNIRLGKDSPPIILQEGGTLIMSNGRRLKMFPPATIDVRGVGPGGNLALGIADMPSGGIIIDNTGVLMESIPPETKGYKILDPVWPYVINVNRSFDVPPGYEVPTKSKEGEMSPYVTLPLDPPPDPKLEKFKPKPNFTIPQSLKDRLHKMINR